MGTGIVNDIPLEAVLKYIKRERDKLQIKYNDALLRIQKLEKENEDKTNIISKRDKSIEQKDKELDALRKEHKVLMKDVRQSEVWKDRLIERNKIQIKWRDARRMIDVLVAENWALKRKLREYER